jgi:hypothetical protein
MTSTTSTFPSISTITVTLDIWRTFGVRLPGHPASNLDFLHHGTRELDHPFETPLGLGILFSSQGQRELLY